MTSLTFQQKQHKLLICYFPNYKLVESFDSRREHQHKFQQHITFFPIHGIAKSSLCACNAVTFIHMIQNSSQRAHNAGVDLRHASPPLHWQPYSTTSLKQQRIYRAWVSSEQSHMPLAVAKSCSPRKRSKLFAGRTGPCPTKEGISCKQSGLHQASTNAPHFHPHQQGLGN